MPCYLFTYHAYGSWLPARKQGYVKRKQGILPSDADEDARYRRLMTEDAKVFDGDFQQTIISVLLDSREKQSFEVYYIATELSHMHALLGWHDERPWLRMRSTIKGSISRVLNQKHGKHEWFSEGGSRKRVQTQEHFDYLMNRYLPKHRGWKWCEAQGLYR